MSGWGVYDVIIEIILNIFQGFMVTWYLQKCLGTDREKKDVYITGTVYTFLYLMLQGYFTDFEGVGILIYLGLSLFFSYMMLGGTFIKKLVYNIMLVFVLAFSSVIAGNIVGLVLSKDFMELIKTRNIDYYIAAFVNQIVLMSFLLIIVKMEERTRSFLKDRYIILTLSIPIITIMVCAGVLSIDADNGNKYCIYIGCYNRTCGYKYYNNYIVNDGTKYMSETGGKCYSDGDVGASEAKC